jgi:hypothetical protein
MRCVLRTSVILFRAMGVPRVFMKLDGLSMNTLEDTLLIFPGQMLRKLPDGDCGNVESNCCFRLGKAGGFPMGLTLCWDPLGILANENSAFGTCTGVITTRRRVLLALREGLAVHGARCARSNCNHRRWRA